MSRIAYVDGRYSRHRAASVHIEDRGFQFSDGIYEVWAVLGGQLIDRDRHFDRLERSARELRIGLPMSRRALGVVIGEVLRRNLVSDGMVYLQITRGVAPRDHGFPDPQPRPTLVVTAKPVDYRAIVARQRRGVTVITMPDQRWARRDIKSVSLLANVLAKQAARDAGGYEAWQVDDQGRVTEGASTNAWIVAKDGRLVTRAADHDILRGVTRDGLFDVIKAEALAVDQSGFTIAQAKAAAEAFLTASTGFLIPVVAIDGVAIGDGAPGPVTLGLLKRYWRMVAAQSGVDYWI